MTLSLSRRAALATAGSIAASAMLPSVANADRESKLIQYGRSKSFDVVHQMSLTNRDRRLSSLELWIPIPIEAPEQTVSNLTIDPKTPVFEDKTGQARVARLFIDQKLPGVGETQTLKLSYRVTRKTVAANVPLLKRLRLLPYKKDVNYLTNTSKEAKIDIHSVKIAEVAEKIRGERKSAVAIAHAAYLWVIEHTKYQLLDKVTSATYCLEQGHGECTEYAALFVALCRAAGVPARPVTGFLAGKKPNDWHAWAEFMLPNGQWIPVDPTEGDRGQYNQINSFGNTSNNRIAFCKTYDVHLNGVLSGESKTDILQGGHYWWTWRSPDGQTDNILSPEVNYQLDSTLSA